MCECEYVPIKNKNFTFVALFRTHFTYKQARRRRRMNQVQQTPHSKRQNLRWKQRSKKKHTIHNFIYINNTQNFSFNRRTRRKRRKSLVMLRMYNTVFVSENIYTQHNNFCLYKLRACVLVFKWAPHPQWKSNEKKNMKNEKQHSAEDKHMIMKIIQEIVRTDTVRPQWRGKVRR